VAYTHVTVASPTAKIYVNPAVSGEAPGASVTVNIDVADVKGLYSYDVVFTWDPTILNVTSVTEGTILSRYPKTYNTFFTKRVNNTAGWVYLTCTILGNIPTAAASGSGTLTTIKFQVQTEGGTPIDLHENYSTVVAGVAQTKLRDIDKAAIPYTLEDGYFIYPLPKLSVEPSNIMDPDLLVDTSFDINISIIDIEGLHGWSLYLWWNSTLLNVTNVDEGPFLKAGGTTVFLPPEIDQTAGSIYLNCTLADTNAVSGNGTLATIAFQIKMLGSTSLNLNTTKLVDINLAQIPHVAEGGFFNNIIYNVAIESVEVSPNEVKAGDSVDVTIVAKNKGTMTETFDVRVWANSTLLGTLPVTDLLPDDTQTLTFNWNTKDVAEGLYQIKAEAVGVSEDVDSQDNEYTNGTVRVTSPGQQLPLTLIIAILAAVVVIGVAIFLYSRRARSPGLKK
jgi:hypothetical protein